LNTKNGLPSNYVYCALPLHQNNIYLGTRAGLVLLKDDQTEVINSENGLINNEVRTLIQDSTGGLWIGTSGGLSYRKDGRWIHFDEESNPALPNNVVYQLQLDQSERIYGLTNRGVFRLTPTSSNSDTLSVRIETFTTEDGLPSMEGNAGASFRDSRGRIWFGTTEGAAMISPDVDPQWPKQPKTLLNAVLFKNELRDYQHQKINHFNRDSSLTLDHEQNEITFKFACLNFKRESETRFRTQLVGFDQDPSDWQNEGQKAYTNLPAGNYKFVVEAMDYAGKMAKPATFSFSIQPSPWQTPIAYAGYVLLAGLLLYSLHQLNVLRLKKRQQELEYLVDVRTREVASQKRALEKNNKELTELNDLKTQFLSIASHDLKNPLQNILGYAQLIREESHKDGTISPMAESIYRASQNMLGLIKELLDTTALESGKLALNKTPLDLGALVSIVCDDYDMRIKKKQQVLECHTEQKCLVHADAHRLREVMENLLSNAIKYSPNNTKITINVYPDKRENQSVVVCKVTDQGLGLSKEDMIQLFGKFKKLSARPTAGESSTGLGLSIVKHLVELHNGRIWAESPGKNCGSTFFIELPASQPGT
jgi:signal transduction histidine kinase